MKPTIPITDPRFVYVNSTQSDIRKRFDRIRREQAKAKAEATNVRTLPRKETA